MNIKDKYLGSIKLAAIGDALGWITEFEKSQDDIKKKYHVDKIITFHDWTKYVGGKYYGYIDEIKRGSYSDDTQLLLAVARSIKQDGTVDNEYFSKIELPAWLLYSRGAGRTIKNAARKIKRKSAKWNNNFFTFKIGKKTIDYRESGANGAAMRILPIALANYGNLKKINKEIFDNSIITHGHPRAIIGAMLYGLAVNTILKSTPSNFNYKFFLTELGKDIEYKLSIDHILNNKEITEWISIWNKHSNRKFYSLFKTTIIEAQNSLRDIFKSLKNNTNDKEVYNKIGCFDNETKGSGISTVVASIYLTSKYYFDPVKAIEIAVNQIGSDTDSIAAFTGGLLGALHGQTIIPNRWKEIQDYNYLEFIAERLFKIAQKKMKLINFSFKKNIYNRNLNFSEDIYQINEEIYFDPLGYGKIVNIERQKTLTKGKYNLILDVDFKIGQSCRFVKLFDISTYPKFKELQ